ncbi:hypothetical protein ACGLS1_001988, partial [Neisseria gonorrhoeae]
YRVPGGVSTQYGGLTKIKTVGHLSAVIPARAGIPTACSANGGGGLRACQIKTVFKRVAMRHMQGLEAQSIYYFHRNGRPRPPCKPLKDKPPGLIRAAVGNHLPLDLFEI